jgi:hypothetical protein
MLKVTLDYHVVVDDIMANKALKLQQYELDDSDWDIVEDLLQVLKVCILPCHNMNDNSQWLLLQMYKDAMLFFSQDSVVTIANVVLTMDRIDSMLSKSATSPLAPAVRHALTFAWKLMDKYYSKTDLSNVYRIAMGSFVLFISYFINYLMSHLVLHPQLKLKYFQQHGWSMEWVKTAEDIVREEFGKYKTSDSGSAPLVCLELPAVIMRLKGSYL